MDLSLKYDNYISLPKDEAYSYYCDELTNKSLKWLLMVLTVIFGISTIAIGAEEVFRVKFFFSLFSFLSSLLFVFYYKNIFSVKKIRKNFYIIFISAIFLFTGETILNNLIINNNIESDNTEEVVKKENIIRKDTIGGAQITITNKEETSFLNISFLFALVIFISIYVSRTEYVQMYSIAYGIPFISQLVLIRQFNFDEFVVHTLLIGILLIISLTRETKKRNTFMKQYDYFNKKEHDAKRMRKELDYAREIQIAMLPEAFKKIGDIEVASNSTPAMEVGGDYYDYFEISENEIGFFICDVSGHGVASALMLSGLRSCMHILLEDSSNPKEVFNRLNRMIRKTQNRKMFVTAVFAVINTKENTCSLFNAGHLPPFKIDGKTNEILKIKRHGVTLGAMDYISAETEESEVTISFSRNDKLILYTDGVTEAMNRKKDEYGFYRLEELLYTISDKTPEEILNSIISSVNNFSEGIEQRDDMTIMVISRN